MQINAEKVSLQKPSDDHSSALRGIIDLPDNRGSLVACCTARPATEFEAMTSRLRPTSSRANAGKRSIFEFAARTCTITF